MILSPSRVTLPACCALAAAFLPAQDRVTVTDERYPGCGDPGWITSLVVDDLTGAPIAGAEVFLVRESETPIAGEFWFTRKGVTDTNGMLRVRVADIEEQWHFLVLRHPAYGTCTIGYRPDVWRVGRAFDVPVLIRDWRGDPVPGAKIGFCGSCGHGPDLQNAVTGANGVAVLRGIDPQNDIADVYVQHPGVGLGYASIEWYPGGPPAIIDCGFSAPMTGRVVDHRGQPVADAYVSAQDVHRGPWARTGADGAFTVLGARGGISKVITKEGRECYFGHEDERPVTIRLPDPAGDDPKEATTEPPELEAAELVEVRYVRVSDDPDNDVRCEFLGTPRTVPNPPKGTIEVPVQGPFVLKAGHGRNLRTRWFDSIADLPPEPIALRPLPPTRVTARLVGPDGAPLAARVRIKQRWTDGKYGSDEAKFSACEDGALQLGVDRQGLALLEVRPEREGLRPRMVWLSLPAQGDDVAVDIGAVALAAAPQLRVVDAAGEPLGEAGASMTRAGLGQAGEPLEWQLDATGAWVGPDLREGDAVVVQADADHVPHRTVLDGGGPWTIRVPAGALELVVTDADGARLKAEVLLGDELIEVDGARVLRGLPLGALRVFVSAPGHRTAIVDATVTATARAVEVRLPKR